MKLHTLEFDDDQVGQIDVGASPDVANQTQLDDRGSATMLTGPTPTIGFTIICDGPRGRIRASEAEHLLSQPTFSPVAVSIPAQPDLEGYYAASSVDRDVRLSQDDDDDHHQVPLTLSRSGTDQSHFRILETNPNEDIDHEFGNDTTLQVGIPAAAKKTQWFNPEDEMRDLASPVETRSAEGGNIEIFDIADGEAAVGTGEPALIYQLDLEADGDFDVHVFDTQGSETEDDWVKIFSPKTGVDEIILDTSLLRLRLDEPNGTLEAEEWDSATDAWATVGLEGAQPSTVTLFDVDLMDVAMVRDRAQLTFDVDGSLFALNANLNRGYDAVQFSIPEDETGPVPQALEDWLSPIASASVVDPQPAKGLVARNNVRR
ncbi:hypothetical protein [Natrinema sp. DC36]|uniref:hypothetical protein n=1 Tax=Natrinema sp. DC36 TaxID=2878680 RepID=UPI001CF03BE3|nr:hypothetical protein [Natrinema sp. DC36]